MSDEEEDRRIVMVQTNAKPILGQDPTQVWPNQGTEEWVRATVSSESRDRVATKSDDAEVPVFLWTEQFILTSEGWYCISDAPKVEWAMNVLRHRMFILVW